MLKCSINLMKYQLSVINHQFSDYMVFICYKNDFDLVSYAVHRNFRLFYSLKRK